MKHTAILFCLFSVSLRAQIIVNGDFEQPAISPAPWQQFNAGSSALTGWTITLGSVDIVNMPEFSASQILDLNGIGNGAISQVLATTAGQKYQLTLEWQPNTSAGVRPVAGTLSWNGVVYGNFVFWVTGTPQVTTASFVFAGTGNDVLKFGSSINRDPITGDILCCSSTGILLDNIVLTPVSQDAQLTDPFDLKYLGYPGVPEPLSTATLSGACLLGFALWRAVGKQKSS